MTEHRSLVIFEHETLRIGSSLTSREFRSLARYHDTVCDAYYDIGYGCVKFNQFVGIICVDELSIEVLPKIDRSGFDSGASLWRTALLEMLTVAGYIRADILSDAPQSIGKTPLFDILALQFAKAVESLVREGLIRKYRREQGNVSALKGKLIFAEQVRRNLTRPELWYTDHSVYDRKHALNGILRAAIDVLYPVCSTVIKPKLNALRLDFADIPPFLPDSAFFDRLRYDRQSTRYREAIDLAWLILRNLSPRVEFGITPIFAIMFDMNALFERTVLQLLIKESLRRNDGTTVEGKESCKFWRRMYLQPDIIIRKGNQTIIVDTKWKIPNKSIPGEQDIRQVFAYGLYFSAQKVILLYPGNGTQVPIEAAFEPVLGHSSFVLSCSMDYANLVTETGRLNKDFAKTFLGQF